VLEFGLCQAHIITLALIALDGCGIGLNSFGISTEVEQHVTAQFLPQTFESDRCRALQQRQRRVRSTARRLELREPDSQQRLKRVPGFTLTQFGIDLGRRIKFAAGRVLSCNQQSRERAIPMLADGLTQACPLLRRRFKIARFDLTLHRGVILVGQHGLGYLIILPLTPAEDPGQRKHDPHQHRDAVFAHPVADAFALFVFVVEFNRHGMDLASNHSG